MYVKQILNNNVIISLDRDNKDIIVVCRGIGWNSKANTIIDETKFSDLKIYTLDKPEVSMISEVYEKIPEDLIDLSGRLMKKVSKENSIGFVALLMLADHINETVKRLKKGIYLTNALTNEIQTFYKDEYNVASEACDHLKTVYNVNLNNDEIAFIATHLINLNLDNINETLHSIEIVDEVVDIIRRYLNIELKANTYEYSRFITHLKYFSLRVMKRESINSNYDEKLELFIKENYQRVYKCTLVIKSYIARRYGYNITNAEVVYLAIHLQNILNN